MKVVYLFSYNPALPGVLKKINDKIIQMRASGAEVTGLAICNADAAITTQNSDIYFLPVKFTPPRWLQYGPLKILAYLKKSRSAVVSLERALHEINPDVVVMRYGTANPFFARIMKRFRFVFEHNTKEVEQLAMYYNGWRKSGWEKATVFYIEKYFSSRILRRAAGIVGVTNEITQYELKRAGKEIPSITIANGIDTSRCKRSSAGTYTDGTLHLLFLAGVAASWHGVDRLLKSIQPQHDVKVWLAGSFLQSDIELAGKLGDKVEFTGMLKGDELDAHFDKVHIAVASLAPERVGITEMSALKVREYAARAVPFVTAFDDPDLNEELNADFWLRVPSGNDEISIDDLIAFAKRSTKPETRNALSRFAQEHLDYTSKMQRLVEFLKKSIQK
jgi:glycosyltransferase involved in cell wall biosynthesis